MSGKGSKQRKPQVSDKKVRDNWERIFGKKLDSTVSNMYSGVGEKTHNTVTKYSPSNK